MNTSAAKAIISEKASQTPRTKSAQIKSEAEIAMITMFLNLHQVILTHICLFRNDKVQKNISFLLSRDFMCLSAFAGTVKRPFMNV